MDRNSLIGLGLIAAILGIWLYFSGPSKEQIARNKQIRDSIALVQQAEEAKEAERISSRAIATLTAKPEVPDSLVDDNLRSNYKDFYPALKGEDKQFAIENDLIKAQVSSKGGYITSVLLKQHKRADGSPLVLFAKDSARFSLVLNAYDRSRIFHTDSFYFVPVKSTPSELVLQLNTSRPGSYIEFSYSLKPGEHMVSSYIRFVNMHEIVSQTEDQLQLQWTMMYPSQEAHPELEEKAATVYFKQEGNDCDYISPMKDEEKELSDADVQWIAFKQQFFSSALIAKKNFSKAGSFIRHTLRPEDTSVISSAAAEVGIPFGHTPDERFEYNFYFGPNHYNTLKKYEIGLEDIVPTGWSVFSYINKWLVIPLFNLPGNINMGIIILLLAIIMKIVLLPITYKTYMSGAKMRVLKPETDVINSKYDKNADPMKKQQEMMALYRKAGVNPLSGCLPLLLQFPILIALFNFVPAAIELRQAPFLWASDLSTYDSIWDFGHVPFISWAYGDHVSLFAMLMFVSTILYTWMNSSMMPQQGSAQMPGMKFMMYFMPVIFLAVMNTYAAGLSWYYFLANMLTFVQNWIIKKIVSDKKIRAQLEANMKKPVKVSSFQKRLEEMAKQRQQPVKRK